MDIKEIKKIIEAGESETLEFKESFDKEALEAIGAFSNAKGGLILIGVKNYGVVCGIQIGKKTLEDIANRIREVTEPRLQPSLTIVNCDDKEILMIQVQPSSAPVSIRKHFFKRSGRSNQQMSNEEILQRITASSSVSWDAVLEPNIKLTDLDSDLIGRFMQTVKAVGRCPVPEQISQAEFLRKLELIHDGSPTRAAVLLFGNVNSYFPSAYLKMGRFRSPILIVDDREAHGPLIQQLDEVMGWFKERLETEFVIKGEPQREVLWEYPLNAIREAVINMICHRDYNSGAHSQIRLYDDHLTLWNAGGLPPGLTAEALFSEHPSIPRNRKVAQAFFYMGLIEKWGSGTLRIIKDLQNAHLPKPEFISEIWQFKVIFHKQPEKSEIVDDKIQLTLRQQEILALLEANKQMTAKEILGNLQELIAERTLRDELLKLKKMQLIYVIGFGRGAKWIIKEAE